MAKFYGGIADELSPAICMVTLLVTFGPLITSYYFYISMLFLVLIIVAIEVRKEYLHLKFCYISRH